VADPTLLGQPLKGTKSHLWRYRVGDYRVICEIDKEIITVFVIRIGHRKDVYKK
jgi:mRNA interferase RelE/StbE